MFYLIFPLVYYWQNDDHALGTHMTREMKTLLLCLVTICGILGVAVLMPGLYANCEIGLTRLVIFFIGGYLGYHVQNKTLIAGHWVLGSAAFCAGFLLLREMVSIHDFWYRMFYVPFALAVMVFLMWLLNLKAASFVRGVLRFLGERSLELYLTHVIIRRFYWHYFPDGLLDKYGMIDYVLILVAAAIISVILHPLILWLNDVVMRCGRINKTKVVSM